MESLQPPDATRKKDDPVLGSGRIGPYRLEGEIGTGGMGDVYRAIDEQLGRAVAIKHIPAPFARERFQREAKAIARLSHPAIVQVFDAIENDAGGWLVMELIEGQQLSSLTADGPLDLEAALPIVSDLTEALIEAHGKGILHRDLKTENVMVTPAGRAKLLDFGLARWIEPEQNLNLTLEGQIIGTPHAMSPEQAMSLDLDHRSDLFSLGTLIYEVTTGERPFRGSGFVDTIRKICVEEQRPALELNPRIPPELSRLIDRMLEKDSKHRPENATEIAEELQRLTRPDIAEPCLSATRIRPPAPETGPIPQSAISNARRTLTIVHCELATSDARSGALDPEALLEVRPELQRIAARAVARFEGDIGEILDRGLRLYFAHPRAHDDTAKRAVYAAREIVTGVHGLGARVGQDLGLRIGIHTGPVAVATDPESSGHASGTPPGEISNLAATLQGLATSGEILISAATHGIVGSFFDTEARPPARIPGFSELVESYRWLGEAASKNQSR